ncbi:MAG: hypothetical protein IJ640_00285 [Prevotella sp.]|nr:hypothetical protein [Prevotella sp.]
MYVEYEELYEAYIDCRKHKRSSASCQAFEIDVSRNLYLLWKELNNGTYKIGRSIAFIVHHPKDREVFAADFRDRIVHHLIIRRIERLLENEFIEDSYSCRKGKGTLYGIRRCEMHIRECSNNLNDTCYILKGDLKSFFMTIRKSLLYQRICKLLEEKGNFNGETLRFMEHIISLIVFNRPQDNCIFKQPMSEWRCLPKDKSLLNNDNDHGLPIGNLTSQIFANLFLSDFDHFVTETLGFRHYGRYVDDFYIISEGKDKLLEILPKIQEYLSNIGVTLHPKKIYLQEVHRGIQFLGQNIKPYGTLIARRSVGNLYAKLYNFNRYIVWHETNETELDRKDIEYMISSINSYYGYLRQAKSYKLRKKIAHSELMQPLLTFGHFDKDYNKLIINKQDEKAKRESHKSVYRSSRSDSGRLDSRGVLCTSNGCY